MNVSARDSIIRVSGSIPSTIYLHIYSRNDDGEDILEKRIVVSSENIKELTTAEQQERLRDFNQLHAPEEYVLSDMRDDDR